MGKWGPADMVRRFGSPYRGLRPVWAWFAVVPSLQGLVVGVLAGLPVPSSRPWLCAMQYGSIGLVAVAMAAAAVVARPYRIWCVAVLQAVSSLTIVLATVAAMGMLLADGSSGSGPSASSGDPGPWLRVAQAAGSLQSAVLVARAVHLTTVKVLEVLRWTRDGRSVVWVEGMEAHTAEAAPSAELVELLVLTAPDEATAARMRGPMAAAGGGATPIDAKRTAKAVKRGAQDAVAAWFL